MKNKKIFKATIKLICLVYVCFSTLSCSQVAVYPEPIIPVTSVDIPEQKDFIETHKTTALLSLEAPLRCNINTDKQSLIKTVFYIDKLFTFERVDHNDPLPRYSVNNFSFEKTEASEAISMLVKELEIRVIPRDNPYLEMSAEGLKGELSEIINMITEASEVFYRYDKTHKVLELKRRASFKLTVPHNDMVMLAILDVMRGSGIQNIVIDWEDKSLSFEADKKMKNKVEKLLASFDGEPSMLALDVSVYRFYSTVPNKPIEWQDMLRVFGRDNIKISLHGVMGKMLVTSSEINNDSLLDFMNDYGVSAKVSEGLFVVPNKWKSRFDVGRCGRFDVGEADISILAESNILPNRRLETTITLDTSGGEVTRFNPKHRLGENYLIIGIPSKMLDPNVKDAETVILMTPRLIKIVKKTPLSLPTIEEKQEFSGEWLMKLMDE